MEEEIKAGYTRVTEILSPYSDYDSIPEDILNNAAKRGQEIHDICELYAREGIHMPSKYDGYVKAFIKWYDRSVRELLECETRIYCDTYEITGKFDLMMLPKDPKNNIPVLVDIKTCVAFHRTWKIQLAAYSYLASKEKLHGGIYDTAAIQIKKDGTYKVYEYPADKKGKELFMSALRLHRYFKKG